MQDGKNRNQSPTLRPDEFAIAAGHDGNFRFYVPTEVPENEPLPASIRVLTALGMKLHDPAFIEEMLAFLDESDTCGGDCCHCRLRTDRE